jgi:23S rRNA (cytidine1920-2'-O)/16S rRNA (cytidine1409-2'-O)-methyltransferase
MRRMPARRVSLLQRLRELRPDLDDHAALIAEGRVWVDGAVRTNPTSQVLPTQSVKVVEDSMPRGVRKLGFALDELHIPVEGRVCVDVGACTGGFTIALLDRGAARVYAVDVGYGQLLGRLRQDERVVNLERTNLALLGRGLVPEAVDLIVTDVTKLPLSEVVPQVMRDLDLAPDCDLVSLVKPMFELRRGKLPSDEAELEEAVRSAAAAVDAAGWEVRAVIRSAMLGSRGAVEFFVWGRRGPDRPGTVTP